MTNHIRIALPIILLAAGALIQAAPVLPNSTHTVTYQSNLFPEGKVDVTGAIANGSVSTYQTGLFGLTADGTDFLTVCADANEYLFGGSQLYYAETLSGFAQFGPFTDGPTPPMTSARKKLLQQLYTVAWNLADDNNVNSSAFQWAVWEIGRETNAVLSLDQASSTNVFITSDLAVRNQANAFLSSIQTNTPESQLLIWSPVKTVAGGGYERISGQELLTLNQVPEPAMALPLAAAAGLGWLIRRRRGGRNAA